MAEYLRRRGYEESQVKTYEQRSIGADRRFGDYSLSAGVVWNPTANHLVKVNLGRSFRLPGANELAANDVHHGTFRHEQGDPTLRSGRRRVPDHGLARAQQPRLPQPSHEGPGGRGDQGAGVPAQPARPRPARQVLYINLQQTETSKDNRIYDLSGRYVGTDFDTHCFGM